MIDVVESRVKVMLSSIIIFTKEMIRIQRFKLIYPPTKVIGLSFYRLKLNMLKRGKLTGYGLEFGQLSLFFLSRE